MSIAGAQVFASEERRTNDELWDDSQIVAIVQVMEGSFTNTGYDLLGRVQLVLKGPHVNSLKYRNNFPVASSTNKLGHSYLVHLTSDSSGRWNLIYDPSAAIEIEEYLEDSSEYLDSEDGKKGWTFQRNFNSEGRVWSVLCDECKSDRYCERIAGTGESAFYKNKLLGRPYRPPQ